MGPIYFEGVTSRYQLILVGLGCAPVPEIVGRRRLMGRKCCVHLPAVLHLGRLGLYYTLTFLSRSNLIFDFRFFFSTYFVPNHGAPSFSLSSHSIN
eukprot:SAG11_NODE_847_length_6882_cov_3.352204_10_plen_96_part_00